jgi:hypothetical protein
MNAHGAVVLGNSSSRPEPNRWPTLSDAPIAPDQSAERADCEFDLQFFTPDEIRADPRYRAQFRNMLDAPKTTTYCVATTPTRRGPFVCVIPLDGEVAMRTTGLTQYLVQVAQEELAREWADQPR